MGVGEHPTSSVKGLSSRGENARKPLPEYIMASFRRASQCYDATKNPSGLLDLSVAQNVLTAGLIAERLALVPPLPARVLKYDSMGGNREFRNSLATFFEQYLTFYPMKSEHFVSAAGAGASLEMLCMSLFESGDSILTPTPMYAGFPNDVGSRAGCRIVHAPMEMNHRVTVDVLRRGWINAGGSGSNIRGLLLCSPNNPTGQVFEKSELIDIIHWAREVGLQIMVDEVYGWSVFDEVKPFTSVFTALCGDLGDDVHIIWSFSKDFCASGFRVGVVFSQNKAVCQALSSMAYFSSPSTQSQYAFNNILRDMDFLNKYKGENQLRLRKNYQIWTQFLQSLNLDFIMAEAGFFSWFSLASFMKEKTFEEERRLWGLILEECQVLFAGGWEQNSLEPGWFRCCFTALPPEELEVACNRLRRFLLQTSEQVSESIIPNRSQ